MKKKSTHRSKTHSRLIVNHCAPAETKSQAFTNSSSINVNASMCRHEIFDGRDHLVAPVVLIKEGVLNGQLALFEEFGAYPAAWEGVPLPIYHPEKNGQRVTANTPDILQKQVVGRVFNVVADADGKALKGEAWIEVAKAQTSNDGKEVLRRMDVGEALEVSTGYFADIESVTGNHLGKPYSGIQRNMRPDHLALLPGKRGACSWSDGCGMPRTNQQDPAANAVKFLVAEKDGKGHLPVTDDKGNPDHRLMGAAWAALHNGYRGNKYEGPGKARAVAKLKAMYKREKLDLPTTNEADEPTKFHFNADAEFSHDDIAQMIREALMEEDQGCYYYLNDVYSDYFIYSAESKSYVPPPASPAGLFRRAYSMSDDGINLGDATAVIRKTAYVEVANQEQKQMTKEQIVQALIDHQGTPWKAEHRATLLTINEAELQKMLPADPAEQAKRAVVDSLIANASTPWKEDHRVTLMTFDKAYLDTLTPAPVTTTAPGSVQSAPAKIAFNSDQDFLAALPDGQLKRALMGGLANNEAQKAQLIAQLVGNKACKFTKEELQGMELEWLKKVADSMSVNYTGAAVPRFNDRAATANDEEGVPDPPKLLTAPIQAQK